jgi:hypothetical protein
VTPKPRNRESRIIDAMIEVFIAAAVAALLAALLWSKPARIPAPLQLSWQWEGCWITETGCAPWAAEGSCEWGDEDWVCTV